MCTAIDSNIEINKFIYVVDYCEYESCKVHISDAPFVVTLLYYIC